MGFKTLQEFCEMYSDAMDATIYGISGYDFNIEDSIWSPFGTVEENFDSCADQLVYDGRWDENDKLVAVYVPVEVYLPDGED